MNFHVEQPLFLLWSSNSTDWTSSSAGYKNVQITFPFIYMQWQYLTARISYLKNTLSRTYSQIPLRHCSSGLQAAKERKERDSCYCININLMLYLHRSIRCKKFPLPFLKIHFTNMRSAAFISVKILRNTSFEKQNKTKQTPTVPWTAEFERHVCSNVLNCISKVLDKHFTFTSWRMRGGTNTLSTLHLLGD